MNRYQELVSAFVEKWELDDVGIGVLVASHGEQALISEALQQRRPSYAQLPLTVESITDSESHRGLILRSHPSATDIGPAISLLNSRRDWRGRSLFLVITRSEFSTLERLAPDLRSTIRFAQLVPFIPDPSVDMESARNELIAWQRERFGRLDLRGFIRSEAEDVSWRIEDLYQEIHATASSRQPLGEEPLRQRAPLIRLLEKALEPRRNNRLWDDEGRTVVILGHPGAGKSFFLRHLANRAAGSRLLGVERPIAVLASLATFAQEPTPESIIDHVAELLSKEGLSAAHVLHRASAQGRLILLLDGLDEAGDEAGRRRVSAAVETLPPSCTAVVTSRIAGYGDASLDERHPHFTLAAFDEQAIRRYLTRWCELYACELRGSSQATRRQGQLEGDRLATDVLSSKAITELARTPLLLTILAIVHRSGVRLPDHRVELYSHAARVLVERWNRVRSFAAPEALPPLKAADAARLLGPIALDTVQMSARGAIPEQRLHAMLARALESGQVKGLGTADEAIALFRNSLGLLVESAPGMYSFLHLTLAEYFAAWELVRTGAIEALAGDDRAVYQSELREVILLAAGELGIIRADDARLHKVIDLLLFSADRRPGRPSPAVPSLLSGLLADDPGIAASDGQRIAEKLIPDWWFRRRYHVGSAWHVIHEAEELAWDRLAEGRFGPVLKKLLEESLSSSAVALTDGIRGDPDAIPIFWLFVEGLDISPGPHLMRLAAGSDLDRKLVEFHPFVFSISGTRRGTGEKRRFGLVWCNRMIYEWALSLPNATLRFTTGFATRNVIAEFPLSKMAIDTRREWWGIPSSRVALLTPKALESPFPLYAQIVLGDLPEHAET